MDQKNAAKYNIFIAGAYPEFYHKNIMEFDTMCEPEDTEEKLNTASILLKNVQETGLVPTKLFDQSLRPKDMSANEEVMIMQQ